MVGDGLVEVGDDGDLHVAQSTLRARSVHPGKVGEERVTAGSNDLSIDLGELILTITECNDLSGAHEGEIQRIPEENHPLSLVIRKGNVLELLKNYFKERVSHM